MQKKFWLSALLAASLMSAGAVWSDSANAKSGTDYTDAELRQIAAAGDKQKFLQAVQQFVAVNPADPDRLAHAASLSDIAGANLTAISMYEDFMKRFPSDKRVERIRKLVKRLQEEENECPEAFIDSVPDQDFYLVDTVRKHIVRWKPNRIPLKVCVRENSPSDATPADFINMSKSTFEEWSAASGGTLKFVFVNNPDAADIDLMWTKDRSKAALPGKQGVTSFAWKDAGVNKATIVCLSIGFLNDDRISLKSARHVALHEVGHSLGLGHSKNIHDAMYFADMTPDADAHVTANDRELLRRLYTNNDEKLESAAMAVATKYGAPEQTLIVSMLQDWSDVAGTQNDFPRAERLLKQAKEILERHKEQVDEKVLYTNSRDLARALRQQEKWEQAAPYYELCADALRKNHADDEDLITVLQNLSACQRYAKLYGDCKKTCLEVLPMMEKKKPYSDEVATVCMELGTLAFHEREFVQAEQYYKKAVDVYAHLKVNNEDAKLARENHQIAADYLKGEMYKDKIELPFSGKGNVRDWYTANDLYREANRLESTNKTDAVAKFKEAIAKYPYDSAYYIGLASLLMQQKNAAEAAVYYAKAVELNPASFTAAFWYGVSTYQQRKYTMAKAAFLKAVNVTRTPEQKQDVQKYLDNISSMIGSSGTD